MAPRLLATCATVLALTFAAGCAPQGTGRADQMHQQATGTVPATTTPAQ